jgi:chaperonin GroES
LLVRLRSCSNLLGFLVEAGKEIAAVKDVLTGDQKASERAGDHDACPDRTGPEGLHSDLQARSSGLKSELNKLYRLNRIYGDERSQYKVGDTWKQVLKQDYVTGSGVEPYSDPSMVSDMQRMARAQFLLGLPGRPERQRREGARARVYAADIENISELIVQQTAPNPVVAAKGMELGNQGP